MDLSNFYIEKSIELLMMHGPKIILAIVVLFAGLKIINVVNNVIAKAMERNKIDTSLQQFTASFLSILLKILLFISVASMIGIATTSFIAMIGALALAAGLALQGSLANFAGGVLILLFKPFRVGDIVEAQGFLGIVKEIQVFYTIVKEFDNKTVVIPNGALSNGSITNYSIEKQRRAELIFGISYDDDIDKARGIIQRLIDSDERVLKEPAPSIVVSALGDSSVDLRVRVWCEMADLWNVHFDLQENVKKNFDKEDITIPFPQRDVHLYQHQ